MFAWMFKLFGNYVPMSVAEEMVEKAVEAERVSIMSTIKGQSEKPLGKGLSQMFDGLLASAPGENGLPIYSYTAFVDSDNDPLDPSEEDEACYRHIMYIDSLTGEALMVMHSISRFDDVRIETSQLSCCVH